MNCVELKDKYSDYIDCCLGECQGEVEAHLAVCPDCKKELGRLRKMVGALNCLPQVDVSPQFVVRLNERLDACQKGWVARLTESLAAGFPSRALAMAATVALVALSVFYLNSHLSPIPGAEGGIALKAPSHTTVIKPVEVKPAESPFVAVRPHSETGPVHSVALSSSQVIAEGPVVSVSQPESVQISDTIDVGSPRARNPNKVPYVDKVVLLRSSNPSVTAAQVRRAAASFSADHLDYSEKIIIVKVPIYSADLFLQALETMGSTEVTTGPIEQGLPTALFQVIVIPNR